jgi:hypothetical protein
MVGFVNVSANAMLEISGIASVCDVKYAYYDTKLQGDLQKNIPVYICLD